MTQHVINLNKSAGFIYYIPKKDISCTYKRNGVSSLLKNFFKTSVHLYSKENLKHFITNKNHVNTKLLRASKNKRGVFYLNKSLQTVDILNLDKEIK